MKVVACMGEFWKLTDRDFAEQLRAVINGEGFDCTAGRRLPLVVDADVTDLTDEQAEDLLDSLQD